LKGETSDDFRLNLVRKGRRKGEQGSESWRL
jgi:hypothetical protein